VKFERTYFSNGFKLVSEQHSHTQAVSIGLWVDRGARHDGLKEAGLSHFLEHLIFKGTKNRNSFEIAKSLEQLGGELNAFTSRENICLHALVLKEHWKFALEVLSDLAFQMQITTKDFNLEKSVVLQEVVMGDDQYEELMFDKFLEGLFNKKDLGLCILGYENSLKNFKINHVKKRYKQIFSPKNMILSVAGDVTHEQILEEVSRSFLQKKSKTIKSFKKSEDVKVVYDWKSFHHHIEKSTEQSYMMLGMPCASFKDELRFEAFVVNALLGGGMTSKLYQKVREKQGLVYSIYSSLNTFSNFGMLNINASCAPEKMKKVIDEVILEIRNLKKIKILSRHIDMFKTQVIGSLILGGEDIENRMHSIAINEMIFSEYRPVERVVADLKAVTAKSVSEYIERYFDFKNLSSLFLGPQAEVFSKYFKQRMETL
jgi:predicted Zn-dependent peptidase